MEKYKLISNEKSAKFLFSGRLDTNVSREIEAQIENEIQKAKNVNPSIEIIFDVEDVTFIASAFIRICIKAAKITGKQNFSIINSSPAIKKTFKIAGLDAELNVS